jgi:formylglycine-generating enzyme required for sulfatase activity
VSLVLDAGGEPETIRYPECQMSDFPSVGSRPAGAARWEQRDLAGSLYEWVLDAGDPYPDGCYNCVALDNERNRMFRGGSWFDPDTFHFAASDRNGIDPASRLHLLGFRCARTNFR